MKSYNEIMEHVTLTEEMKNRIAGCVSDRYFEAKKQYTMRQLRTWFSAVATLAAAAILVILIYPKHAATIPSVPDPGIDIGGDIEDGDSSGVGGFVYRVFKNLDEMNAHYYYNIEHMVGLPFSIRTVRYIGYGRYPQIMYYGEKRDDVIYYRTHLEPGDYSGFEYPYDYDTTLDVNGVSVGVKGFGDSICVVYWPDADGIFWHSLYYEKGLSEAQVRTMIEKNLKNQKEK